MVKKKVTFCENHPDIATSDQCEQCEKLICYNCRKIFVHRIFCSNKCIRIFISNHARRLFLKALRKFIWLLTWPFHGLLKIQHWKIIEWGLVLGLGFCIYLNVKMKNELVFLRRTVFPEEGIKAVIDTTALKAENLFQPSEGGMVQSSRIDISGEAEKNWIISLSKDDRIIAVQLPKQGKFLFKDVRLDRGQNELIVRALNHEGKVDILQTLRFEYGLPTFNYLVREVGRGPLNSHQVAFTFDGGAEDNAAQEILDCLQEAGVHCTFFLTGRFIQKYPRLVRRIVEEGHEVGNHTMNHPHLTTYAENRKQHTRPNITKAKVQEELIKTAQLFELVTGEKMAGLWRAPYGERNEDILRWAAEAGFKHICWTVGRGWEENMDTMDWVADKNSKAYHSADEIAQKILKYAENKETGANGVIILMHLGTNRTDDFPHKRLPEIISGLKKKGYETVKISEMLSR
jgi:peptidoglycan/xylan/chitin deacetylase (PgdA/CDA1 family)